MPLELLLVLPSQQHLRANVATGLMMELGLPLLCPELPWGKSLLLYQILQPDSLLLRHQLLAKLQLSLLLPPLQPLQRMHPSLHLLHPLAGIHSVPPLPQGLPLGLLHPALSAVQPSQPVALSPLQGQVPVRGPRQHQ